MLSKEIALRNKHYYTVFYTNCYGVFLPRECHNFEIMILASKGLACLVQIFAPTNHLVVIKYHGDGKTFIELR